jgi:hypothetical protein
MGWKHTSREYAHSAEKITENFDIYVSKNENETFYWLRIYEDWTKIFSEYFIADNLEDACKKADERIAQYIEKSINALNQLKKELSELEENSLSVDR